MFSGERAGLAPQRTTIPVVLLARRGLRRAQTRCPLSPPAAEAGRGARRAGPPSHCSPRPLFGRLTSNEERAGREGEGCGGADRARRARRGGRRGHVTAALPGIPSARRGSETVTG